MSSITESNVWKALQYEAEKIESFNLRQDFETNPKRFEKFSLICGDILLDFSKNLINTKTFHLLIQLAFQANLKAEIQKMFAGDKINFTEKRAVLHTALRSKSSEPILVDGIDIMPKIKSSLSQMQSFCDKIHSGTWTGFSGKKIDTVVNIGIGGSDLGPAMVCSALKPYAMDGMRAYFVSNVDSNDIYEVLKSIDPESTLFIIASKTFTTLETLANANTAKDWFLEKTGFKEDAVKQHFVALSTNKQAVIKFGINPDNMFEFWDWVGGRYSLWSAIGLSIALYIGFDNFRELLDGAHYMDMHFLKSDYDVNLPVIMGLLEIWYRNFLNCQSYAVIPYYQYLDKFPAFLQQLEMESNGKYINKFGEIVDYSTAPAVWGAVGTNAQHSFFQMIHQGTSLIPTDFIGIIRPAHDLKGQHNLLMSNFFAQTEALMKGKTENEVREELIVAGYSNDDIKMLIPHKIFEGNKPTNTILINELNPFNLGSLIALYEHKVFVQGILWEINSFDQWGVELGKQLAGKISKELDREGIIESHDSSTNSLINYYKNER